MKVLIRGLFIISIILGYHSRLFCQDHSQEALQDLRHQAELCDSSGLAATESLLLYYYRTGVSPSEERYYISRMISCSQSLEDNENLAIAYKSLLYYFRYYESLDSLDTAIELIDKLSQKDSSIVVQGSKAVASLVKGDYYYFVLDDVENGYRFYNELVKESFNLQLYHIYVKAVAKIVNYYSDDESYSNAIEFARSALTKLPDHNDSDNIDFYYKTDLSQLEYELDGLKRAMAVSTLYDTESDSVEVWNAYRILQQNARELEQSNPYSALLSIMYILDRMTLLPLDTLLEFGNKGISLDQAYNFQDNYIRTFHSENLIRIGKLEEAQKLLLEALEISKSKPNYHNEIAGVYDNLATIHLMRNQPEKARVKFDLHKVYMDSAYTRRKKNDIEKVKTKFSLKEQELKNLQIEEEKLALSHKYKLLSIMGGLVFLALIAAITFYIRMRKTAARLTVLNEEKNKVFAILAHDLRNPISSLRNLSRKVKFLAENDRLDELDQIEEQTNRKLSALNDNLNNILLWAISESNLLKLNMKVLNLGEEISKLIELYNSELLLKNITVINRVSNSNFIYSDPKVVQTIVRNLLSNAIKFSYDHSSILLEVTKGEECVHFQIVDNGVGLELNNSVGTKELRSLRKQLKGSGIGLKICYELAKKSGIDLKLTPNPDGGTISRLSLPIAS